MKGVTMFNKQIFSILCLCITFVSIGFSQGAFLERGQSGFGVSAGFSSNKDASGIGASAGYSISGVFDLGLSVARISLDQKLGGYDVSAIAFSPGITFHAVKQDSIGTPISVSLSAGYERDSYSSTALDQFRLSLNGDYFSIGTSIYGNVYISPTTYVQPSAEVAYLTGSSKLSDSNGNSITSDNNTTIFGFSASVVFETSPTTQFGINPGVSINKDNTTFSIRVGFVFSVAH